MTIIRDALGRFVGAEQQGAVAVAPPRPEPSITSKLSGLHGNWTTVPEGKPLENFDLQQLLNIPEVSAVAGPGESVPLHSYKALPNEVLVQFWPFLRNGRPYDSFYGRSGGKYPAWQLTGPCIFRIDTTAKRDDPRSVYDGGGRNAHGNHFSRVAMPVEERWISNMYITTASGICRGDASFLPDPFACTLELRLFLLGTWSSGSGISTEPKEAYWRLKTQEFFDRYPLPRFVLVPTQEPDIKTSGVYALTREMVDSYVAGTNMEARLPDA